MPHNKNILVMGDSISAAYGLAIADGWVQLTQQKINQQAYPFSLINQSVNGETTYASLTRINSLLQKHHPALVIIELGANDGLNGVPPEVIKDNLRELISRSQSAGANVLLLAMQTSHCYGDAYHDEFYRNYSALAKEMTCTYIPDILQGISTKENLLQQDGLHPTDKAQPLIAKKIWPYLLPLVEVI